MRCLWYFTVNLAGVGGMVFVAVDCFAGRMDGYDTVAKRLGVIEDK